MHQSQRETQQLDAAHTALARKQYREAHRLCMAVLSANPQAAEALFLLGILAADHGNHRKAIDVIGRACAINAREARYHSQIAKCHLALNERDKSLDALDKAVGCAPDDALTLDTIGVLYSRCGQHEEAVSFYRKAAAGQPDSAAFQYNLGAALQFTGDLPGARAAYRAAIDIEPGLVKAWSSLAQCGPLAAPERLIAPLEELFAKVKGDADDALHIGHALATCYEQMKQPEQALVWLKRAKAGKQAEVDYEFARDRPVFEAAIQTLSAFKRPNPAPAQPKPIFIVGLPRTGTTLVDRILSSHADVVSAGELTDFALCAKRQTSTPSALVLDAETLQAGMSTDLGAIGDAYLASAGRVIHDAPVFIDKMPLNVFYAPLILGALPNARIICLRRHPADSVLSNYRQLFATRFPYYDYTFSLEQAAHYYVAFDQMVRAWRQQLPKDRFMEVHYEDVVGDLEGRARGMLEFCDLPWDETCLNFHANTTPVATASSAQVRRPLYSSSIGRWKQHENEMSAALNILRAASLIE